MSLVRALAGRLPKSVFHFCMGDADEQRPALIGSLGSEYIANALSTHKSLEAAIADVHARGALNHPRRCVASLPRTACAWRRDHGLRKLVSVLQRRSMCAAADADAAGALGFTNPRASPLAGWSL
jgi:hypothetical protein